MKPLKVPNKKHSLNNSDFSVSVKGTSHDWSIFKRNKMKFLITLKLKDTVLQGTQVTVTIDKDPLYSNKGAKLANYFADGELNLYEVFNEQLKALLSKTKSTSQGVVSSSIGLSIVSNPSTAWTLINTLQFINYLPLNNQKLTPTIYKFCTAIGDYNWLPNVAEYVFTSSSSSKPFDEASRIGIETSVFFINTGPIFIVLLA